ncbi:SDR family oxidoreductase [Flaviflexus equikiangi]|uniref:SDR family oxidoreductase n=1 Tax=Flaviflexus equikiangi TaxID=2758573 RepID=A0ABS2TEG9_9ACTO|nr:SDR family oxidoreductase [Flaviflexus equikiangi]MBM9433032.1 SDR family oxidoreductase [Flaviflexus equikiangi]
MTKRVLVTGASTGIGAATVRRARRSGWEVLATARRADRLAALAEETGCDWFAADLTKADDVAALAEKAASLGIDALVNNAGGARGTDRIEDGDVADWQAMFDMNVLATLRLTQAIIPHFRERGHGSLLFLTSTAAHGTYPGGGGYTAAKHAERMLPNTLRLELVGEPIRIIEIAPGMVKTEEFSLNRLGSAEAAEKVYEGVAEPLVGDDVAEAIMWTLELPEHVNIDTLTIRPVAQASNTVVARG